MVHFNIPKHCFNACDISQHSVYEYEMETLIPPYTACELLKQEGTEFWLGVAKDNSEIDPDGYVSY